MSHTCRHSDIMTTMVDDGPRVGRRVVPMSVTRPAPPLDPWTSVYMDVVGSDWPLRPAGHENIKVTQM